MIEEPGVGMPRSSSITGTRRMTQMASTSPGSRVGVVSGSGEPVVAQDTGFNRLYPTGNGLRTFTTLDEALYGVEELSRVYERQALAARVLAEVYFDSDKVLGRLLAKLRIS